MATLIAMQDIRKDYVLDSAVTCPVLKSIELFIDQGEFVAIMGPSGSGKSTLMNIIGTLDRPSGGLYCLDDENVCEFADAQLAEIRNWTIGFVFQGFNLLPGRTIIDNVSLPLLYKGYERHKRIGLAEEHLHQVGLSRYRDYQPAQLSGGQQQRVAIARALVVDPKLILADEPTGALDSHTSSEIMEIFSACHRKGITVVLITHDESVARYADRLVQLKDGEVIYDGPMY